MKFHSTIIIFTLIGLMFAGGCTSQAGFYPGNLTFDTTPVVQTINEANLYWIQIKEPIEYVYAGENFTIGGTTNLPPDTTLEIFVYTPRPSSSFGQPLCFSGFSGTGNTSVVNGALNNTWSYTLSTDRNCFQGFQREKTYYEIVVEPGKGKYYYQTTEARADFAIANPQWGPQPS